MEVSDADKEFINELNREIELKPEDAICQELSSIWVELWDEDERNKRKHILGKECKKELHEFLEDVLIKEKKTRDDYIERIENLLSEINDLQKSLEIAIPYEDVESLPLHDMAFRLNKKAEKYRAIKNERIKKLTELRDLENEYCKKLGTVPTDIQFSQIPTKVELTQFENQINAMEQEITNRSLTLKEQSLKIDSLFRELDMKPTLKFEKDVISCETYENFILSNENMKRLEELLTRLERQVEDSKQTADELRQKLNVIWNYLDETPEHKKLFLEAHSGYSLPVINSLKEELNRCEAQKRENISKIVKRMREVLTEEWERCLISKDERDKFRPFYIDCFTQDLCELHELEIERLRNYYKNNEQIFNLIAKHEKLFKKLIELENTSKNANRYYNRGGQLLQEERERKTITKELPIVEEELRNLLRKYESDHGKPFTSFGVPMLLILDEQWNAHFDQKTIDKLARKKGSEKKRKTPLGKRAITTPGSTVASKVTKLTSEKVVSSTTKCITPVTPSRAVNLRKKRRDDQLNSTFAVDSTYGEFVNDLQAKVDSSSKSAKGPVRSTSVKEGATTPVRPVLREKDTQVLLRSATTIIQTTPVKSAYTPMYSPSIRKTPKTLPRVTRRQSQTRLTPAVNHLPLII